LSLGCVGDWVCVRPVCDLSGVFCRFVVLFFPSAVLLFVFALAFACGATRFVRGVWVLLSLFFCLVVLFLPCWWRPTMSLSKVVSQRFLPFNPPEFAIHSRSFSHACSSLWLASLISACGEVLGEGRMFVCLSTSEGVGWVGKVGGLSVVYVVFCLFYFVYLLLFCFVFCFWGFSKGWYSALGVGTRSEDGSHCTLWSRASG